MTKKIILSTLGSHGDIHPFIALGKALKTRGYAPVLATTGLYRDMAEREGLAFFAVRPSQDEVLQRLGLTIEDIARKTLADDVYLIQLIQTSLAASYADLLTIVADADLVLTHRIAYAAKCAAEKCCVPHVDIALSPLLFLSSHDPPLGGTAPFARNPSLVGRAWNRSLFSLIKGLVRPHCREALKFRAEIGLPANGDVPFLQDSVACAAFGLFSPLLAVAQPDFPAAAAIVGSTFYDGGSSAPLDSEVDDFLSAGDPPLVMTLGSFAALDGAEILRGGVEAARRLHRRVVVIAGREDAKNFSYQAGPDVLVQGYAPHSTVFSRAAVVMHHGGVGTAAQALRSGRPQLVIPFFADQPDNAGRIARLGCARVLPRRKFTARRAEAHLQALLDRSDYAENAARIADRLAMEDGAAEAARLTAELAKV
jgi:UDP:flavonoid glycosyltransferase YjiC (YdhE family)